MKKRTLKMLLLITVISSLFVGCGSKKTATTQTDETKSVNNTSTQATQSTEVTKSTESTTAESTENTEATEQTEQATEELVADNNYSAEPAPVQQLENEVNQSVNDNAQNNTPAEDSAPVQQPEQTQPATPEPEQPAQPNNCPYPLLTVTTYQGYTGFFFTWDQIATDEWREAAKQSQIAAGGKNNKNMHVDTFDDVGDVYFQCFWK